MKEAWRIHTPLLFNGCERTNFILLIDHVHFLITEGYNKSLYIVKLLFQSATFVHYYRK